MVVWPEFRTGQHRDGIKNTQPTLLNMNFILIYYQYLLQHLILKNEFNSEVLNISHIVMDVSHCL